MLIPGHAIEAAWFLREYVKKYGNYKATVNGMTFDMLTRKIFEWSYKKGWDKVNGGLWYFKDVLNEPVVMLESNMKLWWPINEAMICSLLFLKDSIIDKDRKQIQKDWRFAKEVCEYGLNAFSDGDNDGGWYGYLKENSKIELKIKGGAYKGFFHVPRSLMFSVNILDEIILKIKTNDNNKLSSKL